MQRQEILISDLCEEIDQWRAEAAYWKKKFEEERDENIKAINERLEESKKGVATALMLALSLKDNEDGSLSIGKEDRMMLAERFNQGEGVEVSDTTKV